MGYTPGNLAPVPEDFTYGSLGRRWGTKSLHKCGTKREGLSADVRSDGRVLPASLPQRRSQTWAQSLRAAVGGGLCGGPGKGELLGATVLPQQEAREEHSVVCFSLPTAPDF